MRNALHMKKTPSVRLAAFFFALLAGPAAAQTAPESRGPTAQDVLGRTISLSGPARRIVSLTPAATEILFAVGAGDRVVGVTEFCDYPSEAKKITKVGGFSGATVSVERIVALKPDLVLVSAEMHGRIISLLDEVGLRSFALEPTTFEQVYADILTVGTLCGTDDGAKRVVASMRSRIDAVTASVAGVKRPTVFWELWHDPLMSAGGPTFVTETIAAAGGVNIFAELDERWPLVSFETLLVRNPDWILIGRTHGQSTTPESVARRHLWSKLDAVKAGRIAGIDADIVDRGGPRLADAVEAIAAAINGGPGRRP